MNPPPTKSHFMMIRCPFSLLPRSLLIIAALWLACFNSGCSPEPPIRYYEVAKTPSKVTTTAEPSRMVAAIVPHGTTVYFIKATDKPNRLDSVAGELQTLVASLKFDQRDMPIWKLAEGWKTAAPSAMAVTNLELSTVSPPIVFTVTQLGMPADNWNAYLESNINRWHGQLGLPSTPFEQQRQELVEVPRENEKLPAYVIDLVGKSAVAGSARGPFMQSSESNNANPNLNSTASAATPPPHGSESAIATKPKAEAPSQSAESPLRYVLPSGWTDKGSNGMRIASFAIQDGTWVGDVAVTAASSPIEQTIGMWQQQIAPNAAPEPSRTSVQNIIDQSFAVTAGDVKGTLYTVRGREDSGGKSIMAVVFPMEDGRQSLYVKFIGDTPLAEKQRDNFLALVSSIRW